jgi:hypothetical protein
MSNSWGGQRPNSGRKQLENKKKKYSIYLTDEEKDRIFKIDTNLSKAVRIMLEKYENLK